MGRGEERRGGQDQGTQRRVEEEMEVKIDREREEEEGELQYFYHSE